MLTLVSWQLVVGGLVLLPVALLVEGAPPAVDARAIGGFVWLGVVGTVPRLRLLVPRALPDAGRRRVAGRPDQPGRRHRAGRRCSPREIFGSVQALGMVLVLGGVLAGQTWGARMAGWIVSGAALRRQSSPEPALACATSRA